MAQQGMTMEELRQQVERSFFSQHVENTELRVNLTEEEARQYYKQHPEEFIKPATVTVREITIVGRRERRLAGQAAQAKIKSDAANGSPKARTSPTLATELSESPGKKTRRPDRERRRRRHRSGVRAHIEKLQPKQVSAPIKTGDNYILFKLESKTAPEPLPFEAVRDQILQKIFNERMDVERKKHIEKLRAQALIEWKDDGYRQMYERRWRAEDGQGGVRH